MKVYAPNKEYTGVSASVSFCNGVGETEDPRLIQWFKDHGYKVEELKAEKEDQTENEVGNSEEQKKAEKGKKGGE